MSDESTPAVEPVDDSTFRFQLDEDAGFGLTEVVGEPSFPTLNTGRFILTSAVGISALLMIFYLIVR